MEYSSSNVLVNNNPTKHFFSKLVFTASSRILACRRSPTARKRKARVAVAVQASLSTRMLPRRRAGPPLLSLFSRVDAGMEVPSAIPP
ncbi:hypothetical protein DL767_001052 [Monosporascus sp. MG133]|nr:hypothetical protein DL767_001052 [Monosporascus sp. MG133]